MVLNMPLKKIRVSLKKDFCLIQKVSFHGNNLDTYICLSQINETSQINGCVEFPSAFSEDTSQKDLTFKDVNKVSYNAFKSTDLSSFYLISFRGVIQQENFAKFIEKTILD